MKLRGHVVAALAVYAADVWGLGMGLFAILTAIVVSVVVAVSRQGDAPNALRTKLAKLAVWCAMPVLVYGTMRAQEYVARARAERVVAAVEAFEKANHRYPTELRELVPTFLPRVPAAHPRLVFGEYMYFGPREASLAGGDPHAPLLMRVVSPPFLRETYDFEKRRWSTID